MHITHAHTARLNAPLLPADAPPQSRRFHSNIMLSLLVVHAINNAFTSGSYHATTNDFSTIPPSLLLSRPFFPHCFFLFYCVTFTACKYLLCWYHLKYGVVLQRSMCRRVFVGRRRSTRTHSQTYTHTHNPHLTRGRLKLYAFMGQHFKR